MKFHEQLFKILLVHFPINEKEVNLQDIYQVSVGGLQYDYPNNKTVEASIRANLQVLRDKGYITFVNNNGVYKWSNRIIDLWRNRK